MFQRLFGPYESAADKWKGRLLWIGLVLPCIIIAYPAITYVMVSMFSGEKIWTSIQTAFFWLVIAYLFSVGMYGFLLIRANLGRGKVTEHKIIETRVERPQYDWGDGGDYELETWADRETENGIVSRKVETQMSEKQMLSHLKEFPPDSVENCKRLLKKYKGSKELKLFLLGEMQKIKADSNKKALEAPNYENPSPQFEIIA